MSKTDISQDKGTHVVNNIPEEHGLAISTLQFIRVVIWKGVNEN